jgi:hypothetical protein
VKEGKQKENTMTVETEFAQATAAEISKACMKAQMDSALVSQQADDLMDAERRQKLGRRLDRGQRLPNPGEIDALRSQAETLRQRAQDLNRLWVERKTAGSK